MTRRSFLRCLAVATIAAVAPVPPPLPPVLPVQGRMLKLATLFSYDGQDKPQRGATTMGTDTISKAYRNQAGDVYAVEVTAPDSKRFHVTLNRGQITWADLEVWEQPQTYGLERYYCPGHNGHVCFYGACDEIRYANIGELRSEALVYGETVPA